jgi:hypothetical protein
LGAVGGATEWEMVATAGGRREGETN